MTALPKTNLSDDIRNEIARLKGAGFHPLPLGGGDAGKSPLIRRWTDPKLTLAQILAPMFRTGSAVYGLRLEGLAVIDCDEDSADLVAAMEARFGPTPVHIKTPRGRHLYYRAAGSTPNLRGEGLPVDIKTGGRSYVVGPLSLRPDGGFYAPVKGSLGADTLPRLRASTAPQAGAAPMQEGARHAALVREAIAMVEQVTGPDELTEGYKRLWWIHGEPRRDLRVTLDGLPRFAVTVETMQHRLFQFLDHEILPDNRLVVFGLSDASILSVLSSHLHVVWSLTTGGVLEDRPVYNKTLCFDPFPFPTPTDTQTIRLRALGEELDAHRKAQQAAHPKLTLTGMYNVLEKLRAGERIEGKDREIYDQGLLGILRDIHDRIDAEVAAAYGWPADLPDAEILQRLVDLNHERAAEEARGLVRWLRPDYQNPAGRTVSGKTAAMDLGPTEVTGTAPWPKSMQDQFAALLGVLADMDQATPQQIARRFQRLRPATVQPMLETLALMGHARIVEGGRFAA
jgi:hypothetical protein